MSHENNNIGNFSSNIFAHNSSLPRKRNRIKVEEAFRTMTLKNEQEIPPPSKKRQETWYHRSTPNSPQNVSQTDSLDQLEGAFSISPPNLFSSRKEISIDDESSEATATTANTSYENIAVKQAMYSLVFGSQRPTSQKKQTRNELMPLTHVDAKIEQMIRKDRLKAMIMTGKPSHNTSAFGNSSIPERSISVCDDFNVNVGTDYSQNKPNSISLHAQDCDMNDNNNNFIRRSKSFDDLDMCM